MSIELLPFSGFALETCATPAVAPGEGQTLTLSLRLARVAGMQPMSGRLSIQTVDAGAVAPLRASVVEADATAVTITF